MAVQRGRSKRSGEAYYLSYGEPLRATRAKRAGFFNILLGRNKQNHSIPSPPRLCLNRMRSAQGQRGSLSKFSRHDRLRTGDVYGAHPRL